MSGQLTQAEIDALVVRQAKNRERFHRYLVILHAGDPAYYREILEDNLPLLQHQRAMDHGEFDEPEERDCHA